MAGVIRVSIVLTALLLALLVLAACTDAQQEVDVDQEYQEASAVTDAAPETEAMAGAETVPEAEVVAEAAPDPGASGYLTEAIPPCTPVDSLAVDPCDPKTEHLDVGAGAEHFDEHEISDAPVPISDMFGDGDSPRVTHIVVRGTFLPKTSRCSVGDKLRRPSHRKPFPSDGGSPAYKCYIDIRANDYYVGTGPSVLTVLLIRIGYASDAGHDEESRRLLEKTFEGLAGREHVMFLGPARDVSAEVLRFLGYWDVQRKSDGIIVAVHPERDQWMAEKPTEAQSHMALLEMSLTDLARALDTAHQARVTRFEGRIGMAADLPMLVTDAGDLRDYYVAVGAYDDGAVPSPPPPPPR